jgi:hypothetical protein
MVRRAFDKAVWTWPPVVAADAGNRSAFGGLGPGTWGSHEFFGLATKSRTTAARRSKIAADGEL